MDATNPNGAVRIQLTSEQAKNIKELIGRDAETIELSVQELEQRIVPSGTISDGIYGLRLAGNCNETLLTS
jgi:hypothetical protein